MRCLYVTMLVVFLTTDPPLAEVWVESGPEGGMVTALVAMPSSPDYLFCGIVGGGLFCSADGGECWAPVEGVPANLLINKLVVDPFDKEIIYAATDGGLFRSRDQGSSWTCLFDEPVETLAINPAQQGVLALGGGSEHASKQRIWVSLDEGLTWLDRGLLGRGVDDLAFAPDGTALYARGGYLWKSLNDGESWEVPGSPPTPNASSLCVVSQSHLYAYGPEYEAPPISVGGGLFETIDGGVTWTSLGLDEITALAVRPSDGMLFAGDRRGMIYRRDAGGTVWDTLGTIGSDVRTIVVDGWERGALTVGGLSGVFRTVNWGNTWRPRMGGIHHLSVTSVAAVGRTLAIGTAFNGVFISRDAGLTWGNPLWFPYPFWPPYSSRSPRVAIARSLPRVLYAGGWSLFKSEDGGNTWRRVFPVGDVSALAVNPADPAYVVAGLRITDGDVTERAIVETRDGGQTWHGRFLGGGSYVPNALTSDTLVGPASPYLEAYFGGDSVMPFLLALEFDPVGRYAYALLNGRWGGGGGKPELLKADLTEESFEAIDFEGADAHPFRLLAVDPLDGNRICVVTVGMEGGTQVLLLWQSRDGGLTWSRLTLPISYRVIEDIYEDASRAGLVVASGDLPRLFLAISGVGVLVSDDDGETWRTINSGLPSLAIRGLAVTASGVFLATGSGLFRLDHSSTAIVDVPDADALPERLVLFPNAPNPFNETTAIRYTVSSPEAQHLARRSVGTDQPVSLVVHDLQGQVVRKLMERAQAPGSYTVVWDGQDDHGQPVASGVYAYRLLSGSFAKTRKAVVLR